MTAARPRTLGAILYPGFELLDLYGPLEMFGSLGPDVPIVTVAEQAGPVRSAQGPETVAAHGFDTCPDLDLVLLPGGIGTLEQLANEKMPEFLRAQYNVPFYFGGTSLLIVVTVTMDTVGQIHAHLLAHQYEGLIKKSKLKGRRG